MLPQNDKKLKFRKLPNDQAEEEGSWKVVQSESKEALCFPHASPTCLSIPSFVIAQQHRHVFPEFNQKLRQTDRVKNGDIELLQASSQSTREQETCQRSFCVGGVK